MLEVAVVLPQRCRQFMQTCANIIHDMTSSYYSGEVLYVPDNWGHNVLNLEPSIGISKQMGTFTWKDGLPDSVLDLL